MLLAQTLPFERPGEIRPDIEKLQESPEKPKLTLPPIQEQPLFKPVPGELVFRVEGFEFIGNTVFSDKQLEALIDAYKHRQITTADLEEIRIKLTNFYIDNGYINSGAIIPDQDLKNNILKLQIIEGRLTEINLQNDGRLVPKYITKRIAPNPQEPLNVHQMQDRLYLLQQNPRIKRINASLGPGATRGAGVLDILITEARPYKLSIEANNHRPPSVGEEQGIIDFTHYNITGYGDTLNLRYTNTDGLDGGDFYYAFPLGYDDTAIMFNYSLNDSDIVDKAFAPLGLENESYTAGVGIEHPWYRSVSDDYIVSLRLDKRRSRTTSNGEPYPFDEYNGLTELTAARLQQTWLHRTALEVISYRHTLSVGVDLFDPTLKDDIADGKFTTWLHQFQWANRYKPYDIRTIFRVDWQLAFDPLLSMEKYAIGGANTVRGYDENLYVGDNAFVGSFETRYPFFKTESGKQEFLIMAFADYGHTWNEREFANIDTDQEIYSAGLGLRWNYFKRAQAQVYWAEPLVDAPTTSDSLQKDSIHFLVRVDVL
jgi:hemolysin activation/secretion protein